jgi:diacylglycerol kinase family enzyme
MKSAAGPIPVFLNATAGTARATAAALHEQFGNSIAVTVVAPESLRDAVAGAAAAGEPVIGVAGGDGTLRTAAAVLVHTRSALLCIPTGTLNTFARRQGIPDIAAAAAALRERRIDVVAIGTVQDSLFLNTLTFGEYARIVRRRERYRRFVGKWPAALLATAGTLATLRGMIVRLDVQGETLFRHTPIVWVGLGWGSFPRLQEAHERRRRPDLEVVLMRSTTKRAAAATLFRLARAMMRERIPLRDPQLEVLHARALTLELAAPASAGVVPAAPGHVIDATADGEVLRASGSVEVGVLDAALRVIQGPEPPAVDG